MRTLKAFGSWIFWLIIPFVIVVDSLPFCSTQFSAVVESVPFYSAYIIWLIAVSMVHIAIGRDIKHIF